MNLADAYATLDVAPDARPDDIRSAYRRLALTHHPDRNGNSRTSIAQFNRITRAYRLLHDRAVPLQRGVVCRTCGHPLTGRRGARGHDADDRCPSCRHSRRGRLMLPVVPPIVVRCTGAAALLVAAGGLLTALLKGGSPGYGLAAIVTSTAAVAWLAVLAMLAPERAPRPARRRR